MTKRSFPSDFLWGVAHAGQQVEGDNSNSDTWFAENVTPTVFKEPSGKAVNAYTKNSDPSDPWYWAAPSTTAPAASSGRCSAAPARRTTTTTTPA